MNQNQNYDLITQEIIKKVKGQNTRPSLLLHVCCAPCSSTVLEYLSDFFDISVYFYNPNIDDKTEYDHRFEESKRFCSEFSSEYVISFVGGEYDVEKFKELSKGLEELPEGGARCKKCFELRLEKAAEYAKAHNFDYFTTSLSVGPMKNSKLLNAIGKQMSEKHGVAYLYSDFKKRNGYKRSIELSKEYKLYRQNYCGCSYSKIQSEKRRIQSSNDSLSS